MVSDNIGFIYKGAMYFDANLKINTGI